MSNRYTAKRYTHQGLTLRLSEWAARSGVPRDTLWRRLEQYKQPMARALTDPVRPGRKNGFRPKTRAQTPSRLTVISVEAILRSWGRA
jgi:hypothetical protein